jgi:hypothetical protein
MVANQGRRLLHHLHQGSCGDGMVLPGVDRQAVQNRLNPAGPIRFSSGELDGNPVVA